MAHPLVNKDQMWSRSKEASPVPRAAETEKELRATARQLRWNCGVLESRAEFAEAALRRYRWGCFLAGVPVGVGLMAAAMWAMSAVASMGVVNAQ